MKDKSEAWQNRIVGEGMVAAGELVPHPQNWRKHPASQAGALLKTLNGVGWVQRVIVNRRTGRMLDGHLRAELARKQGKATLVPVVYVDLSENEERAVLATIDPIANMAAVDEEALAELVRSIEDIDLRSIADELAQVLNVQVDEPPAPVDAEPQIDRAEELRKKWGVETGQLWQLGEHRIICGDCTDAAVVARVMAGEKATLAPTDPPYNVGFNYDGVTVDDKKSDDNYERFTKSWFAVCQSVSVRQIVTPGCYNLALWLRWFDARHWAPWTKTNSMTNGVVSRFWCWEPVLFFGDKWPRSRSSDVFDFPVGMQSGVANHPCPKPLKMWLDLLDNYTEKNDLVYEPFSGSGTTLIACEQLGRRCRAVEIAPSYVAVALERWSQATGKTPELLEAGSPPD